MSTFGLPELSPASSAQAASGPSSTAPSARRSRPSQLQTDIPSQTQLIAVAPSAASSSTTAFSPQHVSPVSSPEHISMLRGLTLQPSPESLRGRDFGATLPPSFQLPDAVLSRRRSSNSLPQSTVTSPGSAAQEPVRGPNLMRRFSNKLNNAMGSALRSSRRQSSANPISRDGSVGPSVIRNRLRSNSNSSAIAPPDHAFYSESEDDVPNDYDVEPSLNGYDAGSLRDFRDYSPLTTTGSPSGTSSPGAEDRGPTIPQALENGTYILKLSKKKKPKRIFLTLDPGAAKIYWDKNSPAKWIYLDDIKEVRTGGDLSEYRATFNAPESSETRGFSLIVSSADKGKNRMIHLVAEDEKSLNDWTTAIESLMKHREDFTASLMAFDDDAVQAFWETEMTRKMGGTTKPDADRRIDLNGLKNICRNLHIHLPETMMLQRFSEGMYSNEEQRADESLDRRGFMAFVQLVKTRRDIRPIYQQYASDLRLGLTTEDFYRFLQESQAENVEEDPAHWNLVFKTLLRKAKSKSFAKLLDDRPRLCEAAFASFFTSDANPLPTETEAVQTVNLDRPMTEYYISSSHNTYLLGRQVGGESSVEGYISALSRGCRCVEIDCWDGPNNEPVVMHGRSFTTQISFREVVNTINKYAFVKSQYPLWISLEVRCGWSTQENMVKIMIDTFGDKLVLQPIDGKSDRLPSPSQLMGRILIKVKKAHGSDDFRKGGEIIGRRRGNSLTSPLQKPTNMDNVSLPGSPLLSPSGNLARKTSTKINTITEGRVPERAPSSSTSEQESDSDKDSPKKAQDKINPILGSMGVYGAGIPFNGFDTPDAREFNHIFSFKEKTFKNNDTPKEKKRALFRHNMRYLMRVYPDATRLSSSNFNPLIYWKRGVQMAALNWQTFDLGMQINQAMFECGTDQTGYVLKSKGLREIQMIPNGPGDRTTVRERKNVKLTVEVISAQQLTRPLSLTGSRTLDPYVEVELLLADDKQHKGEPAGASKENALKLRSKTVRGNGFNPSFSNKLQFPAVQTKYPDLVFVRWTVKLALSDKDGTDKAQVLGTFTAKLEHLKQGYRTLPLLDLNGDRYLFSTLFCKIDTEITSVFVPAPTDDTDGSNSRFRVARPSFLNRSNLNPKTSLDNGLS